MASQRIKFRGSLVPNREVDGAKDSTSFVLRGTDLEIHSDSVSSEWTSESEEEPGQQAPANGGGNGEKRRRRIRTWRIRRRLTNQGLSDSDSSDSDASTSSSSTSSGSSSSSGGEAANFKRQRLQVMKEWHAQAATAPPPLAPGAGAPTPAPVPPAEPPPALGDAPPPRPSSLCGFAAALFGAGSGRGGQQVPARPDAGLKAPAKIEWFPSKKRYRAFALAPRFLDEEDIRAIHLAAQHPSVSEINDRKGYLAFKHRVWRFEAQLRLLCPSLYFRLFDLMAQADKETWKRLYRNSKKKKQVYPEIEYIRYDVSEMGEPCFIEPHVDNKSAVTMVAMLSEPGAYVGGRSCFRRAEGKKGCREMALQQGDVVLFRGEKLLHWITPVTAGRRVILQIELSRV